MPRLCRTAEARADSPGLTQSPVAARDGAAADAGAAGGGQGGAGGGARDVLLRAMPLAEAVPSEEDLAQAAPSEPRPSLELPDCDMPAWKGVVPKPGGPRRPGLCARQHPASWRRWAPEGVPAQPGGPAGRHERPGGRQNCPRPGLLPLPALEPSPGRRWRPRRASSWSRASCTHHLAGARSLGAGAGKEEPGGGR